MNPQPLSPSYLFVPPALAALNITPEDCQLVASYNKSSNQTRFTFSVSWSSGNYSYKEDDKLELSFREPIDESSQVIEDAHCFQAKARADGEYN
ncbi:hypothetical protein GCK32_014436, partial [Trichostrongylus colubriformis]